MRHAARLQDTLSRVPAASLSALAVLAVGVLVAVGNVYVRIATDGTAGEAAGPAAAGQLLLPPPGVPSRPSAEPLGVAFESAFTPQECSGLVQWASPSPPQPLQLPQPRSHAHVCVPACSSQCSLPPLCNATARDARPRLPAGRGAGHCAGWRARARAQRQRRARQQRALAETLRGAPCVAAGAAFAAAAPRQRAGRLALRATGNCAPRTRRASASHDRAARWR